MAEATSSANTNEPQENLPIKKYIIYVLIGGLIASALISIVSVLVGHFGDTAGRALGTTVLIMIHSLIGLAFLSVEHDHNRSKALIINTLFGLIVASMLTSIMGVWNILDGTIVSDLYGTYILGFIAVLIIATLLTAHLEDKLVRQMVNATSGVVAVAFASLLPWVFKDNNYELFDFYYRCVGALFILAATMIILTVIFERLYVIKHPSERIETNPHAMPLWVKILLGVFVFIFGGWMIIPFVFALIFGATL